MPTSKVWVLYHELCTMLYDKQYQWYNANNANANKKYIYIYYNKMEDDVSQCVGDGDDDGNGVCGRVCVCV